MCEVRRYAGFCASGFPNVTVIHLGRGSPHRLGATYPPTTPGTQGLGCCHPVPAYLVLLRVEIARFTPTGLRRQDSSLLL